MPKLNLTIPHRLPQDEALKRIQGLLKNMRARFADKIGDLHEEWTDNVGRFSFSAMGMPVSGTLTVHPSAVGISGDLPFLAALYKDKNQSAIRGQAGTLLA